jgi:DNA polymerase delta subunit 1
MQIHAYRVSPPTSRATHSDLEIFCLWNPKQLSPFVPQDQDLLNYPLTIMSFDIEVHSDYKQWRNPEVIEFPKPTNTGDYVLCFAATVWNTTTDARERVAFCLGDTILPTLMDEKATLYRYPTEVLLLEAVRDWCILRGIFIYSGYNIKEFDWWYMFERMTLLSPSSRFFYWSNVINSRCFFEKKNRYPTMSGYINIDLLPEFRRRLKLDTYSLNAVSMYSLGKKKIDMPAAEQFRLENTNDPVNRGKIIEYCLRDTYLPIELLKHYLLVEDFMELSKVTRVFTDELLNKGQMYRVSSLLFNKIRERKFAISNLDFVTSNGYKGAFVLPIDPGYYKNVVILDFAALYPNIIIALNLCYSTLLKPGQPRYPHIKYRTIATDLGEVTFAQNLPGILPLVCKTLLEARGRAKKKLKSAKQQAEDAKTDEERKRFLSEAAVLKARELNLKLASNSIYGFTGTGADMNDWSCLQIAAATTTMGRQLIQDCKHWTENELQLCGSQVIGGDTDSIFVIFSDLPDTTEGFVRSFELGAQLAQRITAKIQETMGESMHLEFEKVCRRVLMFQKKCRVAVSSETPLESELKLDAKGVAGVRRSFCIFQRNLFWDVVKAILIDMDVQKSLRILEEKMSMLCDRKVPVDELILTTNLSAKYANPASAVAFIIAKKIEERQPGYGPKPGNRLSFFTMCGRASAKVAEKVEDAAYVQEQGLESRIDLSDYIRKLQNTFEMIYKLFPVPVQRQATKLLSTYYMKAYNVSYGLRTIFDFFGPTSTSPSLPPPPPPPQPTPLPPPKQVKRSNQSFFKTTTPITATATKSKKKKRKSAAAAVRVNVKF